MSQMSHAQQPSASATEALINVGAVVLTYGDSANATALADTLRRYGVDADSIVVVRNAVRCDQPSSHDRDLSARRIELDANYGYAFGMNAGVRALLELPIELVLLLTHDVALREGMLHQLVRAASARPDYGVLGPALWWRETGNPFSLGGVLKEDGMPDHRRDLPEAGENVVIDCDWIDGAAMLIRRNVFRDIGLLDERFFLYYEETEFCLRARRAGWRVGVVPSAVADQSPGGGRRPGAYAYLLTRNGLEYARLAEGVIGVRAALRRQNAERLDLLRKTAGRHSCLAVRRASGIALLGSCLGAVAFALRRWGPPPRCLPGLGDIRSAARAEPMRTLVVSTFAPRKDGIARYADQYTDSLRDGGEDVRRVGLPGSAADTAVNPTGWLRPLNLLRAARRGHALVVMWHPEFFLRGRAPSRAATYAALGLVARRRRTTVVVHEPDLSGLAGRPGLRGLVGAAEERARRWWWDAPATLVFHSRREQDEFVRAHTGLRAHDRLQIVPHEQSFRPYAKATRSEARRALALDDCPLFLCAGFLGGHKGFDRAVRAFSTLPKGTARLHVLGSLLYGTPGERAYADDLRELVEEVDGATMDERFVDNGELDLWIQAADALLAPYRSAASSGIVARARLLGTRVVASAVGGLPEQLGPDDRLVEDDDELAVALAELAGAKAPVPG